MNLLQETNEDLKQHGKTWEDVSFIADKHGEIELEQFKGLADKRYDNGYGSAEVSQSLVIVGDNWWLERAEYDGSEWWEYKTIPTKPDKFCHNPQAIK